MRLASILSASAGRTARFARTAASWTMPPSSQAGGKAVLASGSARRAASSLRLRSTRFSSVRTSSCGLAHGVRHHVRFEEGRLGFAAPAPARARFISDAWHMAHRVRYAMSQEPLKGMLAGRVEVDETYVGGKPRPGNNEPRKSGRGTNKAAVVALVERDGRARAFPIERVNAGRSRARFVRTSIAQR